MTFSTLSARPSAGGFRPQAGWPILLLAGLLLLTTWPAEARSAAADSRDRTLEMARQYNQACRLSAGGDLEAALAAFRQAVDLGFDDVDFALSDPDLEALRGNPGFLDLLQALRSGLQLLSVEKGHTLVAGQWTEPFALNPAAGIGGDQPVPLMRLRWQPVGLDFELTLAGNWAQLQSEKTPAPWDGGPGLVLTLAVPDGLSPYASKSHFLLAFGLEKASPVGGIYLPRAGWQRVLELDPVVHINEKTGALVMTGTMPWQSIQPFHPLVDERLGFNAGLRVPGEEGFHKAELFPDPAAFSPGSPIRRFARLEFRPDTETRESLMGKVSDSTVTGLPVELTLAAVSTEAGQGVLTLDFTNNNQESVLPDGPVTTAVNLETGYNRLEQQADFSGLNSGLYLVRAEMEFPSGRAAVWSTMVLKLGESWHEKLAGRAAQLASDQVRTGEYFLQAVVDALASHQPRFNPGPIATTLNDLDRILTRAEQTGSILPPSGAMLLVYPGPEGKDRLCTLYLPAGYRERGPVNPILVLNRAAGLEAWLASRVARSYDFEGHLGPAEKTSPYSPVYLIPHTEPDAPVTEASTRAEAEASLAWALDFFQADRVSLCGVDAAAGSALLLARRHPDRIRGLQVMAGGGLEPWPQASRDYLTDQLGPAPKEVPITWIDFLQETRNSGQGMDLLAVIRDLGYRIETVQTVRGALALTQVADRMVLWAEALP